MKVSVGTSTSSPGPMPSATSARCNAVVPLLHATACCASQNSAKPASNREMYSPFEEIHVLRTQSRPSPSSRPDSSAVETGIRRFSATSHLVEDVRDAVQHRVETVPGRGDRSGARPVLGARAWVLETLDRSSERVGVPGRDEEPRTVGEHLAHTGD